MITIVKTRTAVDDHQSTAVNEETAEKLTNSSWVTDDCHAVDFIAESCWHHCRQCACDFDREFVDESLYMMVLLMLSDAQKADGDENIRQSSQSV